MHTANFLHFKNYHEKITSRSRKYMKAGSSCMWLYICHSLILQPDMTFFHAFKTSKHILLNVAFHQLIFCTAACHQPQYNALNIEIYESSLLQHTIAKSNKIAAWRTRHRCDWPWLHWYLHQVGCCTDPPCWSSPESTRPPSSPCRRVCYWWNVWLPVVSAAGSVVYQSLRSCTLKAQPFDR